MIRAHACAYIHTPSSDFLEHAMTKVNLRLLQESEALPRDIAKSDHYGGPRPTFCLMLGVSTPWGGGCSCPRLPRGSTRIWSPGTSSENHSWKAACKRRAATGSGWRDYCWGGVPRDTLSSHMGPCWLLGPAGRGAARHPNPPWAPGAPSCERPRPRWPRRSPGCLWVGRHPPRDQEETRLLLSRAQVSCPLPRAPRRAGRGSGEQAGAPRQVSQKRWVGRVFQGETASVHSPRSKDNVRASYPLWFVPTDCYSGCWWACKSRSLRSLGGAQTAA